MDALAVVFILMIWLIISSVHGNFATPFITACNNGSLKAEVTITRARNSHFKADIIPGINRMLHFKLTVQKLTNIINFSRKCC